MASDFLTIEVWTSTGLQRFIVLFFMELSTRRVEIGGVASKANGLWMVQIARNITYEVDGFFKGKRYLIHDRDPLYTQEFLTMLADGGIKSVKLPARSPNLNAYAERFVRTIKEGCLDQMILFGEESLRKAFTNFWTIITWSGIIRAWEPVDRSDERSGQHGSTNRAARKTGRAAELLLSSGLDILQPLPRQLAATSRRWPARNITSICKRKLRMFTEVAFWFVRNLEKQSCRR